MSLVGNALIYVNDLKEFMNITTNADDEIIENVIASATSYIEAYCGRKFLYDNDDWGVYTSSTTPHDSIYDGGEQFIYLTQFPVISITSIYYVSSVATDGTITTEAYNAGDYTTNKLTGRVTHLRTWKAGEQNIYVNYKAGYLYADIPAALKQACREIAKIFYFDRQANPNIARRDSPEYKEERHYKEQVPPWIKTLINPYKKVRFYS